MLPIFSIFFLRGKIVKIWKQGLLKKKTFAARYNIDKIVQWKKIEFVKYKRAMRGTGTG
jgi:hypothetical protein